MRTRLQTTKIFLSVLVIFILSCGPTLPGVLTPADPGEAADLQAGETPTAGQSVDIISADNAKNLVEIATWGKGSGDHPTYSPDGTLLAVSSSSGIYLYDSQTLRESMHLEAINARYVFDLAFSPDGQTLSAVSGFSPDEYLVQQWDLTSGSELHSSSVDSNNYNYEDNIGVLSPDGRTLALIFDDATMKLWDAASGQEFHSMSVEFAEYLAFSPDGKTLASANYLEVTLWDVSSGSQIRTIDKSNFNPIKSLVFSPDGSTLAAGFEGYRGGRLIVWDVASGSQLQGFSVDEGTVFCLAFSPDGKMLASGSADAIKLWDTAGGNELLSINASNLESLTFSPDVKTLVSSSSVGDDSVSLWDAGTGDLLNTLKGDNVYGEVIFSSDSRTLAYASSDDTVRLRDTTSGEVRILGGHPGFVTSLAFSADGSTLASASTDEPIYSYGKNVVKLWDVAGGSELFSLNSPSSSVWSVAFSPDGKLLASGSSDNTVELWDVAGGSQVRVLGTPSESSELIDSVAFSPDGKTLAFGSSDNTVKLWDVASGSEVRTLSGHTAHVISIIFSPDGKLLISQSYDENKLWDVTSGQELATLSTTYADTAISPDGKALATGFLDGTVKVLDPANRNELYTLSGLSGLAERILRPAFSPDGSILATTGENMKLWDAASGQELASFSISNLYRLAFSPDGKLILSSSESGMSLWGIQP